jgi:predicted DNA-binding protein (MmcQ/YjbR family)
VTVPAAKKISKSTAKARKDADGLRRFALTFPEAHEDHPWGEVAIKVGKKVFVFLGTGEDGVSLSVKLKESQLAALDLPFCAPTGYGLGKSGWVTARFAPAARVPLALLKEWIEESYHQVAPKKLASRVRPAAG